MLEFIQRILEQLNYLQIQLFAKTYNSFKSFRIF